jgi:hypothetical protein
MMGNESIRAARGLAVVIACAALGAPAWADDDRRAALELVEQGVVALTVDQDPGTAERLWKEAARRDPQLAEPLVNLALLAEREERFADAEALLEKARRADPRSKLAPVAARRIAQLEKKRAEDAQPGGAARRRAREAAARALTAVRGGLYEVGLQEAEAALALDATASQAQAALGLALLGLEDWAAARAARARGALGQEAPADARELRDATERRRAAAESRKAFEACANAKEGR